MDLQTECVRYVCGVHILVCYPPPALLLYFFFLLERLN